MKRGGGLEPIVSSADLRRFIESLGGKRLRQTGSHVSYSVPNDRGERVRVGIMDDPQPLYQRVTRDVAAAMGLTRPELLARMGAPVRASGKPRYQPQRKAKAMPSKADVLSLLSDARAHIHDLESQFRHGLRDPAAYQSAYRQLAPLIADLRRVSA